MMGSDLLFKLAVEGAGDAKSGIDLVGVSLSKVEEYVDSAKNALMGLLSVEGVMKFSEMILGTIEGAAALDGLAKQAGMSAEALSGLTQIGRLSRTGAEDIADSINKMQRALQSSSEETGKLGDGLNRLDVDFNSFKDMAPDEQMLTVAQAMETFADGTGKSQVAMEIFGKTGAKQLEFLKDLATAGELNAKFTDDQIAQSEEFGKELIRLKISGEGWKDELSMGMLPALKTAASATLDVLNQAGGLRDQLKGLSEDGTIKAWTQNTIIGLTYVLDGFSYAKDLVATFGIVLGAVVTKVIDGLGTLGSTVIKVIKGDYAGAVKEMSDGNVRQIADSLALNDALTKTWGDQTFGQMMRAAIEKVDAQGEAHATAKPKIAAATAAVKDQTDTIGKLLASYDAKILQAQQELDSDGKITEAQKLLDKLYGDMANSVVILKDEELEEALAKLNQLDATDKLIDAKKEERKQWDEDTKENLAAYESLQKQTMGIQDKTMKLKDELETIGLTTIGARALTLQRELDRAAILDQKAATLEAGGPVTALSQQYRDQADAIRGLAGEMNAVEWAKTTKAIGDGLSNSLTDALMNGRSLWDAFKSYLINTILDGAIKNALSSAIQGGLNSMFGGSFFGSAASGAAGTAAGGAATGGGLLSGLGSALGVGSGGFTGTGLTGALGIGASIGTGVASTGIAAGSATGVDLGLLGSGAAESGTAAAGAGAGAGTGMMSALGPAALMALGYMALSGPAKPYQVLGTGDLPDLADKYIGTITSSQSSSQPTVLHDISYQKNFFPNDGSTWYEIFGDGTPMGAVQSLSDVGSLFPDVSKSINNDIPHFEAGGDFGGGLRLVGERGIELEATGPSRIWNAEQTASMLSTGAPNTDGLAAKLQQVIDALARVIENTSSAATSLRGQQGPIFVQVAPS